MGVGVQGLGTHEERTLGHGCPGAPGSVPGSVGSGGGRFIVLQQHSTSLANATTIATLWGPGRCCGNLTRFHHEVATLTSRWSVGVFDLSLPMKQRHSLAKPAALIFGMTCSV